MELTEFEQCLVDHVVEGTILDLAPESAGDTIDENVMRSWGREHEVRAEVVRNILRGQYLPEVGPDPHGLRVRGARIVGHLDLDGVTTPISLTLVSCHIPDGLSGIQCNISSLDLSWTVVSMPGELGVLRLQGARINGQLVMRGTRLTNQSGPTLVADGISVGGDTLFNDGFTAIGHGAQGTVRLTGARLGGPLIMSGAILRNGSGPALNADGITVGGGAAFDHGFTATGSGYNGVVRLQGAKIAGQLVMRHAKLANGRGSALIADGMTVGGGAYLADGFTATGHGDWGAVRLQGANIGGQLVMRRASLTNNLGPALNADVMSVGGGAYFDDGFTAIGHGERGAVRLVGAHIAGRLSVDTESMDRATAGMKWAVDGLTFDGFPTIGFDKWLRLLRDGTHEYTPQPYQQLAAAARAAGHDADARRVLIAQRDDQVRRGDQRLPMKVWAVFTKYALGYGYQPWRALIGIAGILLIALVISFFVPGALAHGSANTPCTGVETFQVAVDMVIPLVSTSAGTTCRITSTAGGQFVAWIGVFLTFAGWALTALFAAGFTRAIRKP